MEKTVCCQDVQCNHEIGCGQEGSEEPENAEGEGAPFAGETEGQEEEKGGEEARGGKNVLPSCRRGHLEVKVKIRWEEEP